MSRRESKKVRRAKGTRSDRWVRDDPVSATESVIKRRDPKRAVRGGERPDHTPGTKALSFDESLKHKGRPRADTASYCTFKGHRVTKPKGGRNRRAHDHLRKAQGAVSDLPYDTHDVVFGVEADDTSFEGNPLKSTSILMHL